MPLLFTFSLDVQYKSEYVTPVGNDGDSVGPSPFTTVWR